MANRQFTDPLIEQTVQSILVHDYKSLEDALIAEYKGLTFYDSDDTAYAILLLMTLNNATNQFQVFDPFYSRGSTVADKQSARKMVDKVLKGIKPETKLEGAGLTSSQRIDAVVTEIERISVMSHEKQLNRDEYDKLRIVQNGLSLDFMIPFLPQEYQKELADIDEYVSKQLQTALDPKLATKDLFSLRDRINMLWSQGKTICSIQRRDLVKYDSLRLTPQRLLTCNLDALYDFPPFLIQAPAGYYSTFVHDQPFVWIRKRELDYFQQVRKAHQNIRGDSFEKVLEEFLKTNVLVIDKTPPTGLLNKTMKHTHHFQTAESHVERLTKDFPEVQQLLDAMPIIDKHGIEIDLIANHSEGFSIIGEVKFCDHYWTVKDYYYRGEKKKNKGSERDRLLALSEYFTKHTELRKLFNIDPNNIIIPVFITNMVGTLFNDKDGVVKATPFEVMRVEPFYRLVRAEYDKIQAKRQGGSGP